MTETNTYANGRKTQTRILEVGLALWRAGEAVTSRRIARELSMTHSTVCHHFNRGENSLRNAVAHYAVEQGDDKVVAALILEKHKAVSHFDEATRLAYLSAAAG